MQPISSVQVDVEQAERPKANANSSKALLAPLPASSLMALGELMIETKAFYFAQTISPATANAHAKEWATLARVYGIETFKSALIQAKRSSEFFPSPVILRRGCDALAKAAQQRGRATKVIAQHDDARALWLREYAEDIAAGVVRKPLSAELRAIAIEMGLVVDPEGEHHASAA